MKCEEFWIARDAAKPQAYIAFSQKPYLEDRLWQDQGWVMYDVNEKALRTICTLEPGECVKVKIVEVNDERQA